MKTIEEVLKHYKSECLDGRDLGRLAQFLTEEQISLLEMELKEEYKGKHTPIPFTKENILEQLRSDVSFGFEKALGQRGLSSAMMFFVVRMWNWVLEEGLEDFNEYGCYGLPLFKETALKYGFDNPIGSDTGHEDIYNEN